MNNYHPATLNARLVGRRKGTCSYLLFVIILLITDNGYCDGLPEKINLSRGFAVAMAISKNIDLQVESLNSAMAEIDLARSRGIYDPIFTTSASGGVTAVPGDPFFRSRNATTSIGLTQYLPTGGSISATTQNGYTNAGFDSAEAATTTIWQSTAGISIAQPLLKNAGKETMELGITLAASTRQDTLERLRFVITDTVFAVITSYNHLYTLRQALESRQSALTSAQSFLEEVQKRKLPWPNQAMEVANTEFAIAQRRKDLVEANRSVSDQEANLRYLIGMESKAEIIPIDPPSRGEPPETEDQAVMAALESRPEIKQLRLALQTSQLQERVAGHQSLPELSLTASGGLTGSGGNFGESYSQIGDRPGTFWTAGFQFNLPLGNTAAQNDYRRSKIRTEQVEKQVKALAWRIRNDVETDMRSLISARLQVQTADKSRQYADQRIEEYRKNNRLGTATVQDVLNAENDLIAARNSQMDATETFANAVTKLWRDTGLLLYHHDIHIDTAHPGKLAGEK